MEKLYNSNQLLEFLGGYGLSKSRNWLYYNEKLGRLISPRKPQGRRDRAYTLKQMLDIAQAFSPGGKGYWSYKD